MSLFFLLFFILYYQPIYAESFCLENVEKINSQFNKKFGFNKYLFGDASTERGGIKQYVIPVEYSCDHIHFCKNNPDRWHSMAGLYSQISSVPQGDPRNPIFLYGEDLSHYLEFSFILDGMKMHYFTPTPQKIEYKVEILNYYLRQIGYEEIYYLPSLSKGVVSYLETLKLGSDLDDQGIFYFPFSPGDPRLVTHETSYHLLVFLLPRKWIQRIIDINRLTLYFVQELDQMESFFGKKLNEYYKARLIELRVASMDTGAGNLFISYIRAARNNGFNNLENFGHFFNEEPEHFIGDYLTLTSINSLINPEFGPFESVFNAFLKMVEDGPPINDQSVLQEGQALSYEAFIQGLFEKYHKRFDGGQYQRGTALEFSTEYFSTFRERRRQISEAISHIELSRRL